MRRSTRPALKPGLAAALAAVAVLAIGGVAFADPGQPSPTPYPSQSQVDAAKQDVAAKTHSVAALRSELAAAQQRADAADTAAEIAAEAYNGAVWRLQQAEAVSKKATAAAKAAQAKVVEQRKDIGRLAANSYQGGTQLNALNAVLGADGPEGLVDRIGVVQSANNSMNARYDSYRASLAAAKKAKHAAAVAEAKQRKLAAQAKTARDSAAGAADAAQAAASQVAQQRDAVIAQLAKAQKISVSLAAKRQQALEAIAKAKAAAKAKAEAEAKAKAAQAAAIAKAKADAAAAAAAAQQNQDDDPAQPSSPSSPSEPPPTTTPPAPPSGGAGVKAAIAYAKAQLGKPYRWGAAGPSSFDCSGLTMRAWERGGISLPHYSVAQYETSTHISIGSAQPGDLLFWSSNGRPSGIHHVALYLGGGSFIEAPHTGANVRYNSIGNWYPDFAARPN